MSFRYSPWSGVSPEVWSIHAPPDKDHYFGKVLDVSTNKEEIFKRFAELEAAGTVCFIRDPKGDKVS